MVNIGLEVTLYSSEFKMFKHQAVLKRKRQLSIICAVLCYSVSEVYSKDIDTHYDAKFGKKQNYYFYITYIVINVISI